MQSLGAIAYDPIWFFYRGPESKNGEIEAHSGHFKYLAKKTISIGVQGSGTYAQASRILDASGFDHLPQFVYLPDAEAVKALRSGKIDGAFIVDAYEAPNVQALLSDPNLHLVTFKRAEADVKIIPYLHILNVPQGSFDLKRNFPSQDMKLLATTTNLLVDDRMHPAIQF
ncbi:TAXI family TRAP transporter solute-binding subunit [Polynucleobacter necessarius]|uniref:TAXI family TRAP transporter solute-binding subunit n=1 Tax=Polynucleobacter necessarius TaxID=576610 RepID=UPI0018D54875|nr:TAXI family TRAP transporter solute-binding subunit [Polynucleobacter necessarius]